MAMQNETTRFIDPGYGSCCNNNSKCALRSGKDIPSFFMQLGLCKDCLCQKIFLEDYTHIMGERKPLIKPVR